MNYVFSMWKNTRMIVLVAVCAAIYAAALIAFKTAIPLVPGITEVRVAGIFLMTFGFLFGPAGAWGLALGNLIGDAFGGTLTPSSAAGFVGNFLQGYLAYALWTRLIPFSENKYQWRTKAFRSWLGYVFITIISSAASAVVISTAVDTLGAAPFTVLSKIILANNIIGGLLGVALLIAVYGVTKGQLNLLWTDIMDIDGPPRNPKNYLGAWIVAGASMAGIICGFLPGLPMGPAGWSASAVIILGSLLL